MKSKLVIAIFSLFLSSALLAQTPQRLGEHEAITSWTAPAGSAANLAQGKEIVQQIMDAVGLQPNFEIVPANIENAAAVVYNGKRFILYNPQFFANLIKTTGTNWAAISVLAHEIGHHLDGHTVTGAGSQPAMELEADEFSGFVLRKMGATLAQAQAAMKTIAGAKATYTHPASYDRLASIEKGWSHADDQLAGRATVRKPVVAMPKPEAAVPPVAVATTTPVTARLDSRYILGDVFFNAEPAATFYVTTNYNLVKVKGNGLAVLGKVATLNSNRFPYLIYDEANTQLLVDKEGNIVTRTGAPVGYLRNHK